MPWGWILCALLVPAGLLLLAAALFHVRVRAGWGGAWESLDSRGGGYFRVEYGFPGFMRRWESGDDEDKEDGGRGTGDEGEPRTREPSHEIEDDRTTSGFPSTGSPTRHHEAGHDTAREAGPESSPSSPPSPFPRPPSRKRGRRPRARNRWRRALFRFVTDGKAWRLLLRHGRATARAAWRLLKPRVALAVGHPDPVKLARLAGCWHASAPLFSSTPATLELRFQDRRPTFAIRAEGGFSVLALLLFAAGNFALFPWIGLGRRAWRGWWRHELEGWRGWVYKRLQE